MGARRKMSIDPGSRDQLNVGERVIAVVAQPEGWMAELCSHSVRPESEAAHVAPRNCRWEMFSATCAWEKGVDPSSRQRISLSIKRLGADPGELRVDQLDTGQTVEATVRRVMRYGAFARVADGVEGLIHISELRRTGARSIAAVQCSRVQAVVESLSASRTPRVTNV